MSVFCVVVRRCYFSAVVQVPEPLFGYFYLSVAWVMTFRHSELSCRFNYAFVFMLFISGSELCDSRQVDSVLEYLFSSAFTNTDQQCMPPPCSACQKVSHPSLSLYQSYAERANRAHNDSSLLPSRKKLGWNSQRSTPLQENRPKMSHTAAHPRPWHRELPAPAASGR